MAVEGISSSKTIDDGMNKKAQKDESRSWRWSSHFGKWRPERSDVSEKENKSLDTESADDEEEKSKKWRNANKRAWKSSFLKENRQVSAESIKISPEMVQERIFDHKQWYSTKTKHLTRVMLGEYRNLHRFNSQLQCNQLMYGNQFALLDQWQYKVYDYAEGRYQDKTLLCNTREDLELAMVEFRKFHETSPEKLFVFVKTGHDISESCVVLAFQVCQDNEVEVFKNFVKLVCEANVGLISSNCDEDVEVTGLCYRSLRHYGVLKVSVQACAITKVERLCDKIKQRLPKNCKYIFDTLKVL